MLDIIYHSFILDILFYTIHMLILFFFWGYKRWTKPFENTKQKDSSFSENK